MNDVENKEVVYIVTSGEYSNYGIEAVFKDKLKAQTYCKCHEDCGIEEYYFNDDKIYTMFNVVKIPFEVRSNKDDRISFIFECLSEEDNRWESQDRGYSTVISYDYFSFTIVKRIPDNYDEEAIKKKYTKVCYDLKTEIQYLLSQYENYNFSTYKKRRIIEDAINELILKRI